MKCVCLFVFEFALLKRGVCVCFELGFLLKSFLTYLVNIDENVFRLCGNYKKMNNIPRICVDY